MNRAVERRRAAKVAGSEASELRRRAERALGWEEGASKSFSFPTLREFIRTKSPKLHYLMGLTITSGAIVEEEGRPECPHCGCSYFVLGDSSDQGICHDCGRLFELTQGVENKNQE